MGQFILGILKFVFSILLLPIIVATAVSLSDYFGHYPSQFQFYFNWGMVAFLITFLFVYQFWGLYEFGQKMMGGLMRFAAPLDQFLAYVFPFYLILIFIGFFAISKFLNLREYDPYFMFFIGFFFAMHILLTAQELQQQESKPIKTDYLAVIGMVFLTNVILVVLGLGLVFEKFKLMPFFQETFESSIGYYQLIVKKILALGK